MILAMEHALVYSLIAFSIVFVVLGGMTLLIFAMRLLGDEDEKSGSSKGGESKASPAPVKPAQSASTPASHVKAHPVAAITAAILAITHGRGRITSIARADRSAPGGTTERWRQVGIFEGSARHIAPAWKR